MQLGTILRQLSAVDQWLDDTAPTEWTRIEQSRPWWRIMKVSEGVGKVASTYAQFTSNNSRKPGTTDIRPTLDALAHLAITAILAIQHFTKDEASTGAVLVETVRVIGKRMILAGGIRPSMFDTADLWMWDEQDHYDSWLEQCFAHVPDCWDDDVAAEFILLSYIRGLENRKSQHTEWCDQNYPNGH